MLEQVRVYELTTVRQGSVNTLTSAPRNVTSTPPRNQSAISRRAPHPSNVLYGRPRFNNRGAWVPQVPEGMGESMTLMHVGDMEDDFNTLLSD